MTEKRHLQGDVTKHPVSMYLNELNSDHSRKTMMTALRRALAVALDAPVKDVSPMQVFEFAWVGLTNDKVAGLRKALKDRYSNATAHQTMTAVRSIMGKCFDLGMIDAERLMRIKRVNSVPVKNSQKTGRALDRGEVTALARTIAQDDTPAGARDQAILSLLWDQGPRVGELVELTLSDYDPSSGDILIRSGKGEKDRLIRAHNKTKNHLDRWIDLRGEWEGPLFVPVSRIGEIERREKPLSRWSISKMLKKRARQAGVQEFSPHDLRRTCATELIALVGIDKAKTILGHEDISTTAAYDRSDQDEALRASGERHYPA